MRHAAAILLIAAFACSEEKTVPPDHLPDGPGRWETKAPAMTPASEAGIAVARGLMITVGGFSDAIQVYDPATNTWRSAGAFPAVIDHVGAADLPGDQRVMVAGFFSAGLGARAETYAFDPEGDRLEPKAPLLRAVGAGMLVRLDQRRLALIGGSYGTSLAEVQLYDAETDTWSAGPPMSTPRDHLGAAVLGGKLYAIGGRNSGSFILDVVEVLDLESMTWSNGQPLQVARSGHAVGVAKGKIYAFGGEGAPNPPYEKGVFPEVEEFDPATNTWRFVTPMPTPRHGIQAATINDVIYVPLGGDVGGAGTLGTLEVFTVP